MAVAAAIRFIIKLLFKKLSLLAALREPVPIWRFAAGAGLFNMILNLVRRLIALKRKERRKQGDRSGTGLIWNKYYEAVLACSFASLGLYCLELNDHRVVKVLIYSRAVAALVHFLGKQTNLFEPCTGSSDTRRVTVETVIAITASTYCCYAYVMEVGSLPPSFLRTFHSGAGLSNCEKAFFDSLRAVREIENRVQLK